MVAIQVYTFAQTHQTEPFIYLFLFILIFFKVN